MHLSVLGGQGQAEAPGNNWRPSNVGEDGDRKKLAAKEHKKILDEQIAGDRRRKVVILVLVLTDPCPNSK